MDKRIRRAQQGNQEAFIQLIEEQKQALYRAGRAILHNDEDVADAMQETVLKAWLALPRLREPGNFKTWITRILVRECCDMLRRQRRVVPMETVPEQEAPAPPTQLRLEVENTLEALAENDRLLLTLFYLNDLPVRQIAAILDTTENTVRVRLSRVRARFKTAYEKE